MIFTLPRTNKYGDFAIDTEYHWKSAQLSAWRKHKRLPTTLETFRSTAPLVTLVYIVPKLRSAIDGDVIITKADFERLEQTKKATTILMPVIADHVALIPRGAVGFSNAQKAKYAAADFEDKNGPTLGECMLPGFRPQDMRVGVDGNPVMPGRAVMNTATAAELVASLG